MILRIKSSGSHIFISAMISLSNRSALLILLTLVDWSLSCPSSSVPKPSLKPFLPTRLKPLERICIKNTDESTFEKIVQDSSEHESCVGLYNKKNELNQEIDISWDDYIKKYCEPLAPLAGSCYRNFLKNLQTRCLANNSYLVEYAQIATIPVFLDSAIKNDTLFGEFRFKERSDDCHKKLNYLIECTRQNTYAQLTDYYEFISKLDFYRVEDSEKSDIIKKFCTNRAAFYKCFLESMKRCDYIVWPWEKFLVEAILREAPCESHHFTLNPDHQLVRPNTKGMFVSISTSNWKPSQWAFVSTVIIVTFVLLICFMVFLLL